MALMMSSNVIVSDFNDQRDIIRCDTVSLCHLSDIMKCFEVVTLIPCHLPGLERYKSCSML